MSDSSHGLPAGRVGRAHGLDGSFYVTGARPRLLAVGTDVTVAGETAPIVRRAGTEQRPIVRLEGIVTRAAVEELRGLDLTVDRVDAPMLGEGEWWAHELEGCEVVDGERHLGVVTRLVELPSCEALEVRLTPQGASRGGKSGGSPGRPPESSSSSLLVPMVKDAIRSVDVSTRRVDVNVDFLGV